MDLARDERKLSQQSGFGFPEEIAVLSVHR